MKVNALVTSLIKLYKYPVIKKLARVCVLLLGADITTDVRFGKNVQFPHNAFGTVIGHGALIEDDVVIFQGVTLGFAYANVRDIPNSFGSFVIKKGAVLCAGAKILSSGAPLVVGENTVIGANSVLTRSTGDNEVWVGIPARKVGVRRVDEN
jgi:serine O-acetyltransferase